MRGKCRQRLFGLADDRVNDNDDTVSSSVHAVCVGLAPARRVLLFFFQEKINKKEKSTVQEEGVKLCMFYLYKGMLARRLLLYRKRFEVLRHHLHSQVRLL